MFCYQCEQTAKGEGCTKIGVCGKQPEVAALQDLVVYAMRGLSQVAVEGRKVGISDPEVNSFTSEAMFSTLTNVDFDPERFPPILKKIVALREQMKSKVKAAGGKVDFPDGPANLNLAGSLEGLTAQGEKVGIQADTTTDRDIHALIWTVTFGIKGIAAYADHARILGKEDEAIYAFIHEGLAAALNKDLTLNDWIGLTMKAGEINLRAMEILDAANTETYGHPVPTKVPLGHKKGKAILVSGHDLKDMELSPEADRRKGNHRLYPRGDAAAARLSRTEEIWPFLRTLRNRVAESAEGICRISRGHHDDHQLHSKTKRVLPGTISSPRALWAGPGSLTFPTKTLPRSSKRRWPCPVLPKT